MQNEELIGLTSQIVTGFVSRNATAVGDIAGLIASTHAALAALGDAQPEAEPTKAPAVSIRASVKPDYLVSMEDGTRHKTLKRHLRVAHGLSPEEYRAKWGLPPDYPMVAPNYSEKRRALAVKIGLGQKRK